MKKLLKSRLVGNILSLLVLQGSNYLFPLLTFPYLVRTLGTENYGVLVFCVAIMQFLNIFADYGFNISGTRDIAVNKQDKDKVNDIYNVILTIKLIFTLLVGIVYIIVIETLPFFNDHKVAYLLSFLILIGNSLFPIWLYQGLERMKYMTYMNIVVKILVTIFIFVFIRSTVDIDLAVFLQTLYFILPGIISIFFVKLKFHIDYTFITDIRKLAGELVKGRHVFLTNLWINFYNQGPLVLVGFLSGNIAAGHFGIGQKIMGAFYGLSQPVTQAVYPHICELYDSKKEEFHRFKKKFIWISSMLSLLISILLFVFSSQLVAFVVGKPSDTVTRLIQLFSLIVFLAIMNTVMARIMYAMNLQNVLNKSYVMAAFAFALLSVPFTIWLQEFGMALVVIVAEGIVFLLNIRNLKRQKEAI
ncbi:oligosaccharide flippase family protein [Ectobacillus sp. sgz5001026]|uniref:oligosaccharide flippase family protein n=1 Tax=Ectobacillus sp. sgz5001026 TaxID=3242473 RepID=UPI0036D21A17